MEFAGRKHCVSSDNSTPSEHFLPQLTQLDVDRIPTHLPGVGDFVLKDEVDAVAEHLESARVEHEQLGAVRRGRDVRPDRHDAALRRPNLRQPVGCTWERRVRDALCVERQQTAGSFKHVLLSEILP